MRGLGSVMIMLVRILASSFVGLVAVLFVLQRKLVWPRPSEVADPRKHGAQLLEIPGELYGGSRKRKVAAAYFPARDSLAPVFVFFHGNADQIGNGAMFIGKKMSRHFGTGFLAVEYPGYPLSRQGSISEKSAYEAAEIGLRYLVAKEGLAVAESRVILLGQSIGCSVALEMALRGYGAKVVLISPFLSLPDLVAEILPDALAWLRFLLLDKLMNKEKILEIKQPVCIVHGERDEIVPFDHGYRLSQLATTPVQFHPIKNTGHNDIISGVSSMELLRIFSRFGA